MKKPERVEVGQWRGGCVTPLDVLAFHVASINGDGTRAVSDDGLQANVEDLARCEYLGSGSNPEPSEWMIETLAEHVNAIVDRAAEPTGHARTLARHIVGGGHTRWNDIREGVLLERAVLSLYSILRKLGKW